MQFEKVIEEIESNGGFDFNSLRQCYNADSKDLSQSFKSWFIGYLIAQGYSKYISKRVAEYYYIG